MSKPDATDEQLLKLANHLASEEQLLAADRIIQQVKDSSKLSREHHRIMAAAKDCRDSIDDLTGNPDDDKRWIRQGEAHGSADSLIYYRLEGLARLTCRIETPIEQSLLVPLLSVLNEVDLYQTWIPSFRVPRLGIRQSHVLQEKGKRRCNKTLQIVSDVAWPFHPREVIIQATVVDDIYDSGFILIRLRSQSADGDPVSVRDDAKNFVRGEFQGAMLFRACPLDHPALRQSHRKYTEPLILVSFKMYCDPKMSNVPVSVVNFVTRTAIGTMWNAFVQVAVDVRGERRPAHARQIQRRKDFYDWVAARIDTMLAKLDYCLFINYLQS